MAMARATKEIKKRLREAGYKNNSVQVHGWCPAYIEISIKLPDNEELMPKKEMKELLAKVFGKEYAEEEFPTPTGNWLVDGPVRRLGPRDRRNSDHIFPQHGIQEREAEAIFGWREKKFFCSCSAYYDEKKDRDDCMQSH